MPNPRAKVDVERFDLESPETPQQRQARIAKAVQNAQALTEGIKSRAPNTVRDARDDQVMRKAYRRAVSDKMSFSDLAAGLGHPGLTTRDAMLPDMAPLGNGVMEGREFLTEEFPTNHDDMIMEDLYSQQPIRQPRQPGAPQQPIRQPQQPIRQQRQVLTEERPATQRRPELNLRQAVATAENWRIKRYLGETRSGTEVHVWKVENTKTGNSLRNLFRIEGVASRIAMILNETGDASDPRIVSLINAYEKRDKLIKEARALEKSADGKEMKTDRLRALRAEINQLDYRLGV